MENYEKYQVIKNKIKFSMGLSEYYTAVIYGFRIEKESVEKATGAYKYKNRLDKCYETYVSILRVPYMLTKKDNDDKEDLYDNYEDGTKIEELNDRVEMSACGDDYSREPFNETEAYLSFHKIKVSGRYDNIVDPNKMLKLQASIEPDLIEKTKQWAKSKSLKLENQKPEWFVMQHTFY